MFGRNKNKEKETVVQETKVVEEKPMAVIYDVNYVGGHPMYPKDQDVAVVIWNEGIQIYFKQKEIIAIPYNKITNVENMDERKMKAARVVFLGVIGALWKKKYLYTVIEYKDELNNTTNIVLDFHKQVQKMQPMIYQKVIESRND